MESRFYQIAKDLGNYYQALGNAQIALSHKREDLAGRKLHLTPAEGWPGKNADERNTAAEKTFADDSVCKTIIEQIRRDEWDLAEINGNIQALEAERRALEWELRAKLVAALAGQRENHTQVDESAFDDAGLSALDSSLIKESPVYDEESPF